MGFDAAFSRALGAAAGYLGLTFPGGQERSAFARFVGVEVSGEPGLYGCLSGARLAAIAGAGGRALEMTLSHVATRQQFGLPVAASRRCSRVWPGWPKKW